MRILWLVALSTLAWGDEKKPARCEPDAKAPKGEALEWTSPSGRIYWYRLPAVDAGSPNLVVMLHGTGMSHQWAFANYLYEGSRFREGDILLAPESEKPDRGFFQAKPDEEEVAALIRLFKKRFPVGNVYLYGHSQGAFFCYWFAGERPELVNGIVAHAGNLLNNVKHPKAAKDNVAIGILHCRSDPVVTSDCAFATDRAYRQLGYRSVRLMVVEGVPEQQGHWPLAFHLPEMLDWLDAVCPHDAATTEKLARRQAERLKAFLNPEEGTALDPVFISLHLYALVRHSPAFGQQIAPLEAKEFESPKAEEAVRCRIDLRALSALPGWKSPAQLKEHEKLVTEAFEALGRPNKKTFAACRKAIEEGWMSPDLDRLMVHFERFIARPSDLAPAKSIDEYRARLKARMAVDEASLKALAEALREPLETWLGKG